MLTKVQDFVLAEMMTVNLKKTFNYKGNKPQTED